MCAPTVKPCVVYLRSTVTPCVVYLRSTVRVLAGRVIAHVAIPAGSRAVQSGLPLQVGAFADDRFGLHGSLAHVVVLRKVVTVDQLKYALQQTAVAEQMPTLIKTNDTLLMRGK